MVLLSQVVNSASLFSLLKTVHRDFEGLPSGLEQMKTRTLRPVGTWCGGSARMLPLIAALRRADSRGHGCLLPIPDGHMVVGDFQRGYTHIHRNRGMLARTGAHACVRTDSPIDPSTHMGR